VEKYHLYILGHIVHIIKIFKSYFKHFSICLVFNEIMGKIFYASGKYCIWYLYCSLALSIKDLNQY